MHNNNDGQSMLFEEQARLGLIKINNPDEQNVLSTSSYKELRRQIYDWVEDPIIYAVAFQSNTDKVFSTGSDQGEILAALKADKSAALKHFQQQYEAIWGVECYTKPFVPIVNASVAGSVAALVLLGTHLVAGEKFGWSVPGIKYGFFPDAGVRHILAGLPSSIGMYLGLTGREINRADAVYLGLIEHAINANQFETILEGIRDADPLDPILDGLNQQAEPSEIEKLEAVIARTFDKASIEEIIAALQSEKQEFSEWAAIVVAELEKLPPLSLKVTHAAIKKASTLSADENLIEDYQLAAHFLSANDYQASENLTGTNDGPLNWTPSRLGDVTNEMVEAFFKPGADAELKLPPRELGVDK